MASNPPIKSIPFVYDQSPTHHIKRFLVSLQPHLKHHAEQGKRFLQKVLEKETGIGSSVVEREGTTGRHQMEIINENRVNRMIEDTPVYIENQHLIPSDRATEGKETYSPRHQTHQNPILLENSTGPRRNQYSQRHVETFEKHRSTSSRRLVGQSNAPLTTSHRQQAYPAVEQLPPQYRDEDTESAQRRLARKLNRQHKASIVKPTRSPTPPPVHKTKPGGKRKQHNPAADPVYDQQPEDDEVEPISKKRKIPHAMEIANRYQTKNIHAPNGRLTNAPVKKTMGLFSHGKASKPVHFQVQNKKPRYTSAPPFNENEFLQVNEYRDMGPDYLERMPNVQWRKNSQPLFYEGNNRFEDITDIEPPRRTSQPHYSHLRYDTAQPYPSASQQSYRLNSQLPPPGITNSPSWPTASSEISRKKYKAFRVPDSVRTLSQVDKEGREASKLREKRRMAILEREEHERAERQRRDRQVREREEQEMAERQRREWEIRKREERERAEMERIRFEQLERMRYEQMERENQERLRQEREWQERRLGEQQERDRAEYEASRRDLRGIQVKKWKLPKNHLLNSTQAVVETQPVLRNRPEFSLPQTFNPQQNSAFPQRPASHSQISESSHPQPHTFHIHEHPGRASSVNSNMPPPPIPYSARPKTTKAPTVAQNAPVPQPTSPPVPIPPTTPPPVQQPKGSMLPPPVPVRAITQRPPSVASSTRTQVEIANTCRTQHRLPPPTPQSHVFGRSLPPKAPRQPSFTKLEVFAPQSTPNQSRPNVGRTSPSKQSKKPVAIHLDEKGDDGQNLWNVEVTA